VNSSASFRRPRRSHGRVRPNDHRPIQRRDVEAGPNNRVSKPNHRPAMPNSRAPSNKQGQVKRAQLQPGEAQQAAWQARLQSE